MFNLDDITNKNNKEHNEKLPYIPDHLYRILIIGASGSGKTNALLNLVKGQDDIGKAKHKFLIKKREDAGIKHLNDSKAFIECSNTMDDVYENIDEYNPARKRNILIIFDDMIFVMCQKMMWNMNFLQSLLLILYLFMRKKFTYKYI